MEYGELGPDGSPLEKHAPNEKGECRKLPPLYTRTFPISEFDDWCGEFQPRLPFLGGVAVFGGMQVEHQAC